MDMGSPGGSNDSPLKTVANFLGFTNELGDSKQGRQGIVKMVWNTILTGVQEAACDYGPPYDYDEYFEGALLFETSQPGCRPSSIHSLLNCKVDPNDIDKDDLNMTPMHYCARYCHLAAMRMLVKAKAYVNVLNEFGQTPLIVCVMIDQSVNNLSNQLTMSEFLLDNGAYVDTRDKSGFSPLDYASIHNNVSLVKLLLDYGATARRENDHFAVNRMPVGKTILDRTTDAEIYALMEERLTEEIAELEYKREQEAERKRKEEYERRMLHLREKHKRLKEERQLAIQRNKADKLRKEVRDAKLRELQKKLAMEETLRKLAQHKLGSWERDPHHRWHWNSKKAFVPVNHDYVYNESMKLVEEVRTKRSLPTLENRWKGYVGQKGKLEVKWDTLKAFDTIAAGEESRKRGESAGGDAKEDDEDSFFKETTPVLPFDFKDENDDELEGAGDLEDMLI